MSKRNRKISEIRHVARPGEGALVDVVVTNFSEPRGTSGAHIAINASSAPVPDRRYVADICAVSTELKLVKVMFGQKRIGKDSSLRSLLVVHLSTQALRRIVKSIGEVKDPSFAEIASTCNIKSEAVATLDQEPEQTVAFSANFALFAMSGEEATIDFYQSSPFAVLAVRHSNKLALDPVVRVDLRSAIFFGLVAELKKAQEQFGEQGEST